MFNRLNLDQLPCPEGFGPGGTVRSQSRNTTGRPPSHAPKPLQKVPQKAFQKENVVKTITNPLPPLSILHLGLERTVKMGFFKGHRKQENGPPVHPPPVNELRPVRRSFDVHQLRLDGVSFL